MPELPEVEDAVTRLRTAIIGRSIVRVRPLHRVLATRLPPRTCASLRGARVVRVERRGKHQLLHLHDGRIVHVHFRMSGDWVLDPVEPLARSVRLVMELDDGHRLGFVDPRALGTVDVHPAGTTPALELGPEATDPAIDPSEIRARLATRRGAIKSALLDQRLLAGVGNIYAAEALWEARIHPARAANALTRPEVARLLRAIRSVLGRASGQRYRDDPERFAVYGRGGASCPRCAGTVARIVQAGRSTYFCPTCQPVVVSRAPRSGRP